MFPAGLEVYSLARVFIYIRTLCMRAAKALVNLRMCACADSPEPSVLDDVIRAKIMSRHLLLVLLGSASKSSQQKLHKSTKMIKADFQVFFQHQQRGCNCYFKEVQAM